MKRITAPGVPPFVIETMRCRLAPALPGSKLDDDERACLAALLLMVKDGGSLGRPDAAEAARAIVVEKLAARGLTDDDIGTALHGMNPLQGVQALSIHPNLKEFTP